MKIFAELGQQYVVKDGLDRQGPKMHKPWEDFADAVTFAFGVKEKFQSAIMQHGSLLRHAGY